MPHTLIISDLHLSAAHKHSMAAFRRFIATTAPQAEALYILGDLFEYWAGDDDMHDSFHAEVTGALRSLAASGVKVYLMHGNRDFLMADELASACNATLLDDPTLLDLYGTPTLLSHGDALCTDDNTYQVFRTQVRSTAWRQQFLAQPLEQRKEQIEQLRQQSDLEKSRKQMSIMDVNSESACNLLRNYGYPRLIHGHTHRPARHLHHVDGRTCERWVLGDWDSKANALRCDSSGIKRVTIPD